MKFDLQGVAIPDLATSLAQLWSRVSAQLEFLGTFFLLRLGIYLELGAWTLSLAGEAPATPGVGPYSHTRPPQTPQAAPHPPLPVSRKPISGFPFPYFADPRVPLASRLRERFLQKIGSTPTLHTVRRRQNGRPTKNLRPPPNFLYFGEKYRLPGKFLVGPWFGRRLTQ